MADISIHAPREGGDLVQLAKNHHNHDFNPRPPRGGRPQDAATAEMLEQFQSTPPARGATAFDELTHFTQEISIHAPREGGDVMAYKPYRGYA